MGKERRLGLGAGLAVVVVASAAAAVLFLPPARLSAEVTGLPLWGWIAGGAAFLLGLVVAFLRSGDDGEDESGYDGPEDRADVEAFIDSAIIEVEKDREGLWDLMLLTMVSVARADDGVVDEHEAKAIRRAVKTLAQVRVSEDGFRHGLHKAVRELTTGETVLKDELQAHDLDDFSKIMIIRSAIEAAISSGRVAPRQEHLFWDLPHWLGMTDEEVETYVKPVVDKATRRGFKMPPKPSRV